MTPLERESREIGSWNAPTSSLPIHDQQVFSALLGSNTDVFRREIAMDQSPGYVLTEPLDRGPKRFQSIAVTDNRFEGPPPDVSTNRWMAKNVCDHGARPTQPFEIKSRTPVGEGFSDRQALGRQVHGTEPAPGERAMLCDLQRVILITSVFQEQPAAFGVVVYEAVIAKSADRQPRKHPFVHYVFGHRRLTVLLVTLLGDYRAAPGSDTNQSVDRRTVGRQFQDAVAACPLRWARVEVAPRVMRNLFQDLDALGVGTIPSKPTPSPHRGVVREIRTNDSHGHLHYSTMTSPYIQGWGVQM